MTKFERMIEELGVTSGERFASEGQLREYLTLEELRALFTDVSYSQDELDRLADYMVARRIHFNAYAFPAFSEKMTVQETTEFGVETPKSFGVSWPSIGTVPPQSARAFAQALLEAADRAERSIACENTAVRIASSVLGIATLKVRSVDAKDFHSLSVWKLHKALVDAFEAGVKFAEGKAES